MAKIIRFPVREQESVAYGNYTQLIEAALSKETLNFYMECIEESEKKVLEYTVIHQRWDSGSRTARWKHQEVTMANTGT